MQHGIESSSAEHYRKELADFYLEVCREYFLKDIEERTQVEFINKDALKKDADSNYILNVDFDVDYMHDIEYVWNDGKRHTHWNSPLFIEGNKIKLSQIDVENYLKEDIENKFVSIKYVSKWNFQ